MFNATEIVINAFVDELRQSYFEIYSNMEPSYPGIISYTARIALEIIANSDAPYHDFHHTIGVTLLGQEVLKGKHLLEGGVNPRDWLHFTISLLLHDIGYVRGICAQDRDGRYVINAQNETITLRPGSTDAALTPYHVDRGMLFVRDRFSRNPVIDVDVICANIGYTHFPVPGGNELLLGNDYPALLRAADLIGQLADLNYMRKSAALFAEFEETGMSKKLGYASAADLRASYPTFYLDMVMPHVETALGFLHMTQHGKQWVANLYAHLFAEEHGLRSLGAERLGGAGTLPAG